ncbi:aminotransferase class I/II-fold pyridoxal phosphate-dependent enzyme [Phaeobacter inhibens]|nr:cys/met metabolism PLP-dependent enzyme [Phaeobacter inhibens DSM 17395]AUQ46310.1 cys/met metabolism PLP-dependent enzyme [Phaeobacter inhibens]AXT23030.1 aminotransferase class I/II-fold pyridoxal phosphate-dependent enzyme [Phaeobacter inhibens]
MQLLLSSNEVDDAFGSVAPAIHQSSLFTFPTYDALEERFSGKSEADIYSRTSNPTVRLLEDKLAKLERGDAAIAFGSGMAAISGAVLSLVKAGDRIVSTFNTYSDAYRLFEILMARLGVSVTYVDCNDIDELSNALVGARLLFLESPSSYVFETCDIKKATDVAKQHGVITIFDNSFASPLGQKPLLHGADIVVHSISKYLSGHSDVVAGCVVGSHDLINQIRDTALPLLGAKLSAMEAWLVIRGLRTLPMRLREHQEAADFVVGKLKDDSRIAKIHRAMPSSTLSGAGGLFTVELADGLDVRAFCDALKVFRLGVSWGGFESLALPASVAARIDSGPNALQKFGVSRNAIRLFTGLEGREVLLADICQALTAAESMEKSR